MTPPHPSPLVEKMRDAIDAALEGNAPTTRDLARAEAGDTQ